MSEDEDLEMEEESEEGTMGFQADSDQDTDEEVKIIISVYESRSPIKCWIYILNNTMVFGVKTEGAGE